MDKIAVLDFGGQYAHLIANRIRRLGVFSEIKDGTVGADELREYKGVILSGGPASVRSESAVRIDPGVYELGVPILGICYGHQLTAITLGGEVSPGEVPEYGPADVEFNERKAIFEGINEKENVWMSHFDNVSTVPEGFEIVGKTKDSPITAMANYDRKIFTVQFHPEVTHTPCGNTILENFVKETGATRDWSIDTYIEDIVAEIKEKAGDRKVFLMISGGVDSTVAFMLLDKALGQENVYGLFVDIGFMRKNEREEVEAALKGIGVENLHVYDASKEYFEALAGVVEPEKKREIIGNLFLDIQAKVSDDLNLNPDKWMLGQGTIYPDTIETGTTAHADKIKTHHNQVDKIKKLTEQGKVIEPLNQLYKDEVRMVGEKLGLNEKMVWRHPFPGPGLAVRCLCSDGEDKPANLDDLEMRMGEFVAEVGMKTKVVPIKSVGVQGDERTYRHPAIVYGKRLEWEGLNKLSTQMTNQFSDINRVLLGLWPQADAGFESLHIQNTDLNPGRISVLQEADKIVMDYLLEAKIDRDIWQFPTVMIPINVGSQNGEPNGESIVLRPVCSEEAMTANFYRMDFAVLDELIDRLKKALVDTGKISGIFYDITNKPPGTIEWE